MLEPVDDAASEWRLSSRDLAGRRFDAAPTSYKLRRHHEHHEHQSIGESMMGIHGG